MERSSFPSAVLVPFAHVFVRSAIEASSSGLPVGSSLHALMNAHAAACSSGVSGGGSGARMGHASAAVTATLPSAATPLGTLVAVPAEHRRSPHEAGSDD